MSDAIEGQEAEPLTQPPATAPQERETAQEAPVAVEEARATPGATPAFIQWLAAFAPQAFAFAAQRNPDAIAAVLATPGLFDEARVSLPPSLHSVIDQERPVFGLDPIAE